MSLLRRRPQAQANYVAVLGRSGSPNPGLGATPSGRHGRARGQPKIWTGGKSLLARPGAQCCGPRSPARFAPPGTRFVNVECGVSARKALSDREVRPAPLEGLSGRGYGRRALRLRLGPFSQTLCGGKKHDAKHSVRRVELRYKIVTHSRHQSQAAVSSSVSRTHTTQVAFFCSSSLYAFDAYTTSSNKQ